MSDIKEEFQNWLVNEAKLKDSTSKQFIQAINKVCKDFYNGRTNSHWEILTKQIVSLLIYYNECNNREYYISTDNAETLRNHYTNNVLQYLKPAPEQAKNIFPLVELSIIYQSEKFFISDAVLNLIPEYINAFQFIIKQFTENDIKIENLPQLYALAKMQNVISGDLVTFFDKVTAIISDNPEILTNPYIYLHLQYKEKLSRQIARALLAFYKFLNEKSLVSASKQTPYLGYDELNNLIICIDKIYDNLTKLETIAQVTGNTPKKITVTNGRDGLFSNEVAEALECSLAALRKIKKAGLIQPINENGRLFNEEDVNKLLESAFHQATYPNVDYTLSIQRKDTIREHPEIWCTREKAARILKRNVSTINHYKKEKVLTYIEMVPNSAFFYIPELNVVSKILKLNPRRGLWSLKKILKTQQYQ